MAFAGCPCDHPDRNTTSLEPWEISKESQRSSAGDRIKVLGCHAELYFFDRRHSRQKPSAQKTLNNGVRVPQHDVSGDLLGQAL